MDESDLSLWTAKPPHTPQDVAHVAQAVVQTISDPESSASRQNSKDSEDPRSAEDATSDGQPYHGRNQTIGADESDTDDLLEVTPHFKHGFYIDVPAMDDEEKKEYKYLPGHFTAREIVWEGKDGYFTVKLLSDEIQRVGLPIQAHQSIS